MTWRVLVSCPNMLATVDDYRDRFEYENISIDTPRISQQLTEEQLLEIIGRYDGVIAGDDRFTRRVFEAADRLRVVSKWGVGVDNIDLEAAQEHDVLITRTPDVFGDEVADVVVGYLVLLARGLHLIDRGVRDGGWPKPLGTSIAGKVLGIVGLGSVGGSLVGRAEAMGLEVVGCDVSHEARNVAAARGVEVVEVDGVLRRAEFLALCCPLTDATFHLLDQERLGRLPRGARIVNTARGALIDESALIAALASGHISGAALDVFETEPLPTDSPLRDYEQVILGSHNASNTVEAVHRVNEFAIENLVQGLHGSTG